MKLFIIYLVLANLAGLIVMCVDKQKAIRKAWRIPERTLFLVSIAGGSLGTWAGMYIFHHKTKHWYFVIGMPLIFVIHVAIIVKILFI